MKLFTKRDHARSFVKAKIELEEIGEYLALIIALQTYIEYLRNQIRKNVSNSFWQERLDYALTLWDALQVANEIPWKNK